MLEMLTTFDEKLYEEGLREEIREEIREEAIKAMHDLGLTVDQISQKYDPELVKKVLDKK